MTEAKKRKWHSAEFKANGVRPKLVSFVSEADIASSAMP